MPQRSNSCHSSPPPRKALKCFFLGLAATTLGLAGLPATADLDVVFLLDTTGSMGGELREVKERVGQLAESLAEAREGETLRFGAVAFRDRGDEYVTRVSPLTPDLETSRAFLASLRAEGGGDGPESVVAGLESALSEIRWDFTSGAERQIFLIGDAPPHLDYEDEPKPEELLQKARDLGIVIHSIGCRSLPPKGIAFFRRLAYRTEGSYQHIGKVRSGQTGVAEALLRAAVPSTSTNNFDRGHEITLTWMNRQDLPAGPEYPNMGVLVRHGGLPVPALPCGSQSQGHSQSYADAPCADPAHPKSSCDLHIFTPPGFDLAEAPRAWLGPNGLTVEIQPSLETTAERGGIDRFSLETCIPWTAPIRLMMGGS